MTNLGRWALAVAWLVVAQFATAQTADQEYRIINNMTADSGSTTGPEGGSVNCAPASTYVSHRCYSDTGWLHQPTGTGASRPCVGEAIVFRAPDSDAVARTWSCGDGWDQYITVSGTISGCGRGVFTYAVSCP